MQKDKLNCRLGVRIISIVILLNFLIPFPMFAEPPTMPPTSSSVSETRLYTDSEIDLLIDELSEIALEVIEKAVGEAAKAAVLSMLEREAALLRENQRLWNEAEMQAQRNEQLRRSGIRNAVIAGLASFVGGLLVGLTILY